MTLLRRIIEKEHGLTRVEIASVEGKVDQVLTDLTTQTTTITTAITDHDTSIDSQLTAITAAVNALQNDVSAAISFPYVIERPDENSNRINKIYFYNYSDGIIADLLGSNTELPTLRILDGAGSALTNGSNASTGPSTLINNLDMTRESEGIYFFEFDHEFPNGGSPNADVGTYRLEIKSKESEGPDTFALHPRSFEVVELTGMASGFAGLTSDIADLDGDVVAFRAAVDGWLGGAAMVTAGTDIYAEILDIKGDIATLLNETQQNIPNKIDLVTTAVNDNHGITDGVFEVTLPIIGSTSTLLSGDPTDIAGTPVNGTSNVMKKSSEFNIQVPTSSRVTTGVYQNIVTYDLSWKSIMGGAGQTGGSVWAISNTAYGVNDDVTLSGRVFTATLAASDTETRHTLYGEIQDAIQDGDWYLTLAGQSTVDTNTLTLTPMSETRVSFAYTVTSVSPV